MVRPGSHWGTSSRERGPRSQCDLLRLCPQRSRRVASQADLWVRHRRASLPSELPQDSVFRVEPETTVQSRELAQFGVAVRDGQYETQQLVERAAELVNSLPEGVRYLHEHFSAWRLLDSGVLDWRPQIVRELEPVPAKALRSFVAVILSEDTLNSLMLQPARLRDEAIDRYSRQLGLNRESLLLVSRWWDGPGNKIISNKVGLAQ